MSIRTIHRILAAVTLLFGPVAGSIAKPVSIMVFEDHARYVEASTSYGISWHILELAAASVGLELDPQESSWTAAIERLKSERAELVFGAIKTPEREIWARYSVPLMEEGSAVFARLDNPVTQLKEIDMQTSVIGVSAASVQEALASQVGFKNVYATVDRPQLYKMLENGRIDYLLFGRSIVQYYCQSFSAQKTRNCVRQVGPTLMPNYLHVVSLKKRKKALEVLESLDSGIKSTAGSEDARRLFLRYGMSESDWTRWKGRIEQQ